MAYLSYILFTTKGYRGRFFLLFLTVMLSTVTGAMFPYVIGKLVDVIFYSRNMEDFIIIFLSYFLLYMLNQLLHAGLNFFWANLKVTYLIQLRDKAFKHLVRLKATILSDFSSGDAMKRMGDDVECFLEFIHRNVFYVLGNMIYLCIAIGYLLSVNLLLGLVAVIAMPVISYTNHYFAETLKRKYRVIEKEKGSLLSWITEITADFSQLVLLHAQRKTLRDFKDKSSSIIKGQISAEYKELESDRVGNGLALIGQLLIYGIGSFAIFRDSLSMGQFVAAAGYFTTCVGYFNSLNKKIMATSVNLVAVERYKEFMDLEEERDFEGAKSIKIEKGEVVFQNVDFSYNGGNDKILDRISFTINSGDKVAVVGKSGEGKSTLLQLLYRLYEPQMGKILIDNHDITQFTLNSLRSQIGVVQQSNSLFYGTLRNNITFSDDISRDSDVWEILDGLGLADEAKRLDKQLDTYIGASERDFSGGQKQRIAIARSLFKRPKLLIMDEATSALDKVTEQKVLDFIKSWLPDTTLLFASHRFATILTADHILYMEKGRLVGQGTHESLYKTCSTYQSMFMELSSE